MSITTRKRHGGIERVFYKDVELDQSSNILNSFPILFRNLKDEGIKIERIIEIGSSRGGMPFVLNELLGEDKTKIISYDIRQAYMASVFSSLAKKMMIEFRVSDCFKKEEEIASLIQQSGLTILLCDGGNKIKEFNTFSKHLKQGDIIMVHDYGETREKYKEKISDNNIWKIEWLSSTGTQIEQACKENNLQPFLQEEFINSVWGIRKKCQ